KQQVERVLQMARLEKEDIGLKKEPTDVHELIQDAVKSNAISSKAVISLNLQAQRSQLTADKLHLTNVFFNLLDNAIKYNSNPPEITVSTKNINGSIQIDVQDNGIGISPEDQRKIFLRFYRVPTGNLHDVKGFGLGLSYVKLIVEAQKGKISVTSKPGNGSCFSIVLPLN
ncbi:MAG TPA: HAMP domain-containing sensor histidine kinase, partial [Cyclobacteriaceae bacterium]|nr:HAMP domain-containing sensor histidine kinase [Cyclobacteriaceae bacterium]